MDLVRECPLDGLVAVGRLFDDREVGLGVEHRSQSAQHDRMVVRDEDVGRQWGRHAVLGSTGMHSWTSVPPAAGSPMVSWAPMSMARSRMPRMPWEDRKAPGGSPPPSSRTVRTTCWFALREVELHLGGGGGGRRS